VHVVATAGRVDHGKSILVRALTGMEPDRWEAERRGGMTIDLGFAWMTCRRGPGRVHRRARARTVVTNMLAGAGPVRTVMLVVAADGARAVPRTVRGPRRTSGRQYARRDAARR
jgi:selenocysteine-specific elongation factor